MNCYTVTERVIDWRDMLYRVLKLWRRALIGAVVIGLLAGLYQVYCGLYVRLDSEKFAQAQEKYMITLRDYEATGERLKKNIANMRDQSENQQEYNEKSVLMKIDPMDKWMGSFLLYIDSKYQIDPSLSYQNTDTTARLVSAYASFMQSGELYKEMIDQIASVDEIRFLTEVYGISADPGTATITVSCAGPSEAEVRQMLDFLKARLAEQHETIRTAIGDHDYEILSESVYSTIDLALDATQKANLLAITDYANAVGEANQELITWEKQPEPRPEFGVWYTAKQFIKFFILGALAGAVVMFVWYALRYALSRRIKTNDDWKRFQIPILARITRGEETQAFLPGLDRLIDHWFSRMPEAPEDLSCALAAQNLGAVLKERGLTEGWLVGRLPEALEGTLMQKLDAAAAGVAFRYAGDILADPAAAGKLEGVGEVMLLAERYITQSADVEQMLTLVKAWGKTVLGVVMIE